MTPKNDPSFIINKNDTNGDENFYVNDIFIAKKSIISVSCADSNSDTIQDIHVAYEQHYHKCTNRIARSFRLSL